MRRWRPSRFWALGVPLNPRVGKALYPILASPLLPLPATCSNVSFQPRAQTFGHSPDTPAVRRRRRQGRHTAMPPAGAAPTRHARCLAGRAAEGAVPHVHPPRYASSQTPWLGRRRWSSAPVACSAAAPAAATLGAATALVTDAHTVPRCVAASLASRMCLSAPPQAECGQGPGGG